MSTPTTILISSTNTDAGKTVLTAALAAYGAIHRSRENWGIIKPIQCGTGDREYYTNLFDRVSPDLNPIYLEAPLAPPIAAAKAGVNIDLGIAWQALQRMGTEHEIVLVEAIGGLGTPVTDELVVADLARDWRLPTILVVPVKIGAIAAAVANVALAKQYGVKLLGIVLNCPRSISPDEIADLAPIDLIQSLTRTPVLGCIPYLSDLQDIKSLATAAAHLELEMLLPLVRS